MSVNDKIKVVWKTNCLWRNKPHWPKRKDIKLQEGETQTPGPLKQGDAVKVKFGGKWYSAEMVQSWKPKSKKGMHFSLK